MIEGLPIYIPITFLIATFATLFFFFLASNKSKAVLFGSLGLMAAQGILAYQGFFEVTDTIPPRFALLIGPPTVLTIILFITKPGRRFIDNLNNQTLTYLSIIRIPIEMVLFWLFIEEWMPEVVTFEGRNFDIVAGITAPIIAFFGYKKKKFRKPVLLIWNIVCFLLLANVVTLAILAAPSPFQMLEWDKPTIAVMHLPYCWLAGYIVPVVFFTHLANIRELIKSN